MIRPIDAFDPSEDERLVLGGMLHAYADDRLDWGAHFWHQPRRTLAVHLDFLKHEGLMAVPATSSVADQQHASHCNAELLVILVESRGVWETMADLRHEINVEILGRVTTSSLAYFAETVTRLILAHQKRELITDLRRRLHEATRGTMFAGEVSA